MRPPLFREASAGAECRVCFDGRDAGVLFKPCLCDGSVKYVHVHCLARWRATNANGGRAKTECPNCHFKYRTGTWGTVSWMSHPSFVASATATVCVVLLAAFYVLGLGLAATSGGALHVVQALLEEEAGSAAAPADDGAGAILVDEGARQKVDAFVTALVLFGIAGFVLSAVRGVETPSFLRNCRCNRHRHGAGNTRSTIVFVVAAAIGVGIVLSFYAIYDTVKHFVASGRDRIQEYVLDVRDL
jgi:hypothetical protein